MVSVYTIEEMMDARFFDLLIEGGHDQFQVGQIAMIEREPRREETVIDGHAMNIMIRPAKCTAYEVIAKSHLNGKTSYGLKFYTAKLGSNIPKAHDV